MGCPLGGRGVAWQGCEPLGIEGVQDIADGLVVAAQGLANHAGRLTTGTSTQDLTASQHKGIGRAQPLLQGVLFVLGQWTDIDSRWREIKYQYMGALGVVATIKKVGSKRLSWKF